MKKPTIETPADTPWKDALRFHFQQFADFSKRMMTYHCRIFDYYDKLVVSLAVLTDENPSWRPDEYQLFKKEIFKK